MKRTSSILLYFAVTLMLATVVAYANAPQLMNYQGRLTTLGGTPVPTGNYDLNFRIYDAAVGGAELWHETHNAVPVTDGLFSVVLGSVGAPSPALTAAVFSDTSRWLGITVGADPELSPRVRLTTAAYSFRTATVDGTTGGTISGNVFATGTVNSGTPSQTGRVNVYNSGSADPTVEIRQDYSAEGGLLLINDDAGTMVCQFDADANGTGGHLLVTKGNGPTGFEVDGNYNSLNEPRVAITGSARSAHFRMDQSGDASVLLPTDAVSSPEIVDEPGVATNTNGNSITLTGAAQVLLSRTITLPGDGYVLAIGTCQPIVNHDNGFSSWANFGVSTSSTIFPSNQDIGIYLPSVLPNGSYNFPVTPQTVFELTAGVHTIYLLGDLGSVGVDGSISVYDMQLSLVYFPTSYGTVVAPAPHALSEDEGLSVPSGQFDLVSERQSSIDANNARIARELAAMKAELEQVKRQLSSEVSRSAKD